MKMYANRFGFDGILLDDSTSYVLLDSCKFNENLRGGISCTGVKHLTASYCEANENGRTIPDSLSSLSNPGSGIDIEPDSPDSCQYGYFNKCTFNNNRGPAITTNQYIAHLVYDMHFDSCTIYATREIGIFCTGKKYFFEDCAINAAVAWSSVDSNEANANIYKGCHFSDTPYNGTGIGHIISP
ncbi:MAG: right-handed parallel beta-helix repeat-containing protein [Bacteroidetes bacterium]|nr:right-handed parallel beta-helix repeat-containing protein [Bacteroidota bacterium]